MNEKKKKKDNKEKCITVLSLSFYYGAWCKWVFVRAQALQGQGNDNNRNASHYVGLRQEVISNLLESQF